MKEKSSRRATAKAVKALAAFDAARSEWVIVEPAHVSLEYTVYRIPPRPAWDRADQQAESTPFHRFVDREAAEYFVRLHCMEAALLAVGMKDD